MVEATRKIVPILVDCSEKGAEAALQSKYGVRGYPTVLYVDPDGKKMKEMGSREPKALTGDINGIAKPAPPSFFQNSVSGAIALSKTAKKPRPVVVYVADEQADLVKLMARFSKDLASRRSKFLFVFEVGKKPLLESRGIEAAPAALVLDPAADDPGKEPLAKIALKAGDKPEALGKEIDEAAKKMRKK